MWSWFSGLLENQETTLARLTSPHHAASAVCGRTTALSNTDTDGPTSCCSTCRCQATTQHVLSLSASQCCADLRLKLPVFMQGLLLLPAQLRLQAACIIGTRIHLDYWAVKRRCPNTANLQHPLYELDLCQTHCTSAVLSVRGSRSAKAWDFIHLRVLHSMLFCSLSRLMPQKREASWALPQLVSSMDTQGRARGPVPVLHTTQVVFRLGVNLSEASADAR